MIQSTFRFRFHNNYYANRILDRARTEARFELQKNEPNRLICLDRRRN